jgi:ethanolamine ammonia-lyase small subunit
MTKTHHDLAWSRLKRLTPARIGLGRVGAGLPTREVLRFGLAHAQARDAVHAALDVDRLEAEIVQLGYATAKVVSAAPDRATYLTRPDLGRRLDAASRKALAKAAIEVRGALASGGGSREHATPPDLAIIVADGLSARAVERHAVAVLAALRPWIIAAGWKTSPVAVATMARVALGDEIGALLGARAIVVLIGERPGLSSPDSLGAYITLEPRAGRTDADRNCISNIRAEGLSYGLAAFKIAWLLDAAFRGGVTGVRLKDESDALLLEGHPPAPRLLTREA